MNDSMVEAFVERIDRIERENGRLKLAGALVLIGIAAAMLMGQAGPNPRIIKASQIEAERFVLSNRRGKVLGGLVIRGDGTPMLFLNHKPGKKAAPGFMVAVKEDVMSVNLFTDKSKHQVAIAADKLVLKGKEGKDRIVLLSHEKGIPMLSLNDKDENQRAMLLVTPNGQPYLAFRTHDGKVFWSAPSTP